jgi:hypothetical protein
MLYRIQSDRLIVRNKLRSVYSASQLYRPTTEAGEFRASSVQRIPTAVNLSSLNPSCYFFFKVAPQLFSRG